MKFSMLLKKFKNLLKQLERDYEPPKISILIPFQSKDPKRKAAFQWTLKYWKHALPDAEIIIGRSRSKPFCKTHALNNAANRANGRVLVILDADAYMSAKVIDRCADKILENLDNHLWFVPYRHLYRLNEYITEIILASDPENPFVLPNPLPPEYIDGPSQDSRYGHRYGAMAMIFPREALEVLGGFDERFKGWGGEDVAFLRALDTLYGKHKTTNNPIYHLWHPFNGSSKRTKMWEGQKCEHPNDALARAYHRASRNPSQMRDLVNEGQRMRKRPYRMKKSLSQTVKKVLPPPKNNQNRP